ncbi:LppX_LprAFG lipoprotein [Mycobacterium vicinigordonae]|uniref:LppX_LprAFG lipoprotein n=1 Tax=Mycobacterium vicinigordonae TaxID=1719132 RepID=A0A7D6I0J2_9MYCO|nr:LppX_LprAFG lipoprotein [Mycobacterium vicinigordonae]QLL09535.1 LppX_LprAFG lipoprotein [Mycobacterium vicinigordonae]
MQTPRRLLAVLAALSIATTLVAGCSISKKAKGGPLPDAKTLVTQSAEVTKGVKSAHLNLTVTGKIAGLPLKTLSGDLTTTPTTAGKGNARIIVFGSEVEADFVILDGELYTTALSPGQWTDVGKIDELLHYDPSAILNPETGVANVVANLNDPKAEGRDMINGQSTIRISGKVNADVVNKLAPLNATGPIPTTVWIQETGDHQLAQVMLDKGSGNSIQMTLSNWNQPVQVTKPGS